jgi:hypothetical protein
MDYLRVQQLEIRDAEIEFKQMSDRWASIVNNQNGVHPNYINILFNS